MADATERSIVRLNIGDTAATPELDDAVIDSRLEAYPDPGYTASQRIWLASVDCLRYLKAKYANNAFRQRERVNGVEYDDYNAERYTAISDLLDDFLSRPPSGTKGKAPIIIGGVESTEVQRVIDDVESVRPLDIIEDTSIFNRETVYQTVGWSEV